MWSHHQPRWSVSYSVHLLLLLFCFYCYHCLFVFASVLCTHFVSPFQFDSLWSTLSFSLSVFWILWHFAPFFPPFLSLFWRSLSLYWPGPVHPFSDIPFCLSCPRALKSPSFLVHCIDFLVDCFVLRCRHCVRGSSSWQAARRGDQRDSHGQPSAWACRGLGEARLFVRVFMWHIDTHIILSWFLFPHSFPASWPGCLPCAPRWRDGFSSDLESKTDLIYRLPFIHGSAFGCFILLRLLPHISPWCCLACSSLVGRWGWGIINSYPLLLLVLPSLFRISFSWLPLDLD